MMTRVVRVGVLLLFLGTQVILFAGGQKEEEKEMGNDGQPPSVERTFINIASGGTAGTYFPLAGGLADIWNKNIARMNATAQSTGASVANVNLLRDDKVDVIFVQNDTAYYAYKGEEIFTGEAYPGIRGLLTMYPETVQIISLAETGIETIADLRGKRVAVGAAGSGTEANARQILAAAGLSYADIKPQYLSFGEAASNLKDRNVDAGFVTAGYPTAAVQDIGAQRNVVLVSIDDATTDKLLASYPFYTRTVVPAGTYSSFDRPVNTVSVVAMLAVSEKLDAELVEKMLSTLFENDSRLVAAHKKGAMISVDTAQDGMSIPLHPGAEKFFNSTM